MTIMAEEPKTISQELSIPYIDANAFLEASFHSFEVVSMIHNTSKANPRWTTAVLMAAKEILKFGYKLGQGLGAYTRCKVYLLPNMRAKNDFILYINIYF